MVSVIMTIYSQNIHWFMFLHNWQTSIQSLTALNLFFNHYCIYLVMKCHEPIMNHQLKVAVKFTINHERITFHPNSPSSTRTHGVLPPFKGAPRNPPTRNRRCKSVEGAAEQVEWKPNPWSGSGVRCGGRTDLVELMTLDLVEWMRTVLCWWIMVVGSRPWWLDVGSGWLMVNDDVDWCWTVITPRLMIVNDDWWALEARSWQIIPDQWSFRMLHGPW